MPIYDFTSHQRSREVRRVEPADVVIIEGILVLHIEEIRSLLNMQIFVDTDDDLRLARRYLRTCGSMCTLNCYEYMSHATIITSLGCNTWENTGESMHAVSDISSIYKHFFVMLSETVCVQNTAGRGNEGKGHCRRHRTVHKICEASLRHLCCTQQETC